VGTIIVAIGEEGENHIDTASPSAEDTSGTPGSELGFISPVVARLAAEHNVDLAQVLGTGIKGRIRKQDVLNHIQQVGREVAVPPVDDEIVPLSRLRQLIAEHMVQSKRTSPHVTTIFDCDLSAVIKHRHAHVDAFAQDGIQLTFTPYFVAAVVHALKLHPYVNSTWTEQGILLKKAINVGIATAIDGGLVVPVIKNADSLDLRYSARMVDDLVHRARSGQLSADEVRGGTFTLTNHGTSGSLFATPIINQPQTGILGVGKIHKAPVVLSEGHTLLPDTSDAIAIRPIAYLSFSFDHRVLDGVTADAFVAAVKAHLESWPDA